MKNIQQTGRGGGAKAYAIQAVFEKEFRDYFTNLRFFLVFGILLATCVLGSLGAIATIRDFGDNYSRDYIFLYLFTGSNDVLPSIVSFMSFLGPIVGIILGFDAISSERNSGTLSRVLSLPIYRDTLINAKALAGICITGIITVSIAAVVSGLGILVGGVTPLPEEIIRIALFVVFTVVYIGFWMCLAILFSILFRQPTVSVLCAIAVWIFCSVFVPILAQAVAALLCPVAEGAGEAVLYQNQLIQFYVQRVSTSTLYTEAVNIILNPMIRTTGPISTSQMEGMAAGFLSLPQSILLILAQFIGLLALAAICFALAYILFSRQEIRA
jgi:ABC-2 type transport system permease protein